jgi:CDP-2,3-bis-(O-geranylgeranyl)-sn-glycerol synthase
MLPPLVAILLPKLNQPLDFNQKFRGHRVFGEHKTIRGLVVGTLSGGIIFFLQQYLYSNSDFFRNLSLIDYSNVPALFGFSIGFGALVGDAIKSFFKRQIGIKPGTSWFPWDQIDWVIGSLIFALPFVQVGPLLACSFVITGLGLHLLFKLIGFAIKVNDSVI